jgi:hypothetical protein
LKLEYVDATVGNRSAAPEDSTTTNKTKESVAVSYGMGTFAPPGDEPAAAHVMIRP